ncbi:hypothetical protein HPP92_017389 [Vanilla planifolia]|uniref:Fe2OG dioxygenase domain-containing protein n=1 Tax=Vanilla planifolia TaxID=51239 RepID=A0A835QC52_VANPL|nr:hypothetical protein HPP92_017389 [Vanilla planifolia]
MEPPPFSEWPEPVVAVQLIAESGISSIPERYVKPLEDRPALLYATCREPTVPVVDLGKLSVGSSDYSSELRSIADACAEWGIFHVANHGVDAELARAAMATWREFFHLPAEEKRKLANSPATYEGYGSRLGVEEGAALDWGDYFFLHLLPCELKNLEKWPIQPSNCREVTEEYGRQMLKLCGALMKVLSMSLGLDVGFLQEKFGGEDNIGACMRVSFYPKCPQPELTLGLSAHSDPGGLTVLLPDDRVPGLQVRKGDTWVPVQPLPGTFLVFIGDQIQVLTNSAYRSVDHRVVVNEAAERISIAFFYNPRSDLPLGPARELVTPERPPLYPAMTFNEYRLYIRKKGPRGKSQVESLQAV